MNRGLTGRPLRNDAASDFFGSLWRRLDDHAPAGFLSSGTRVGKDFINHSIDLFVRRLDAFLRRCQGIVEFTDDPQCILRVSTRPAHGGEPLPGGRKAAKGEPIGEIHLWNEHIPAMPPGGADIVWGTMMRRRLRRSLVLLAAFVQTDARFSHITAFCGETAFAPGKSLGHTHGMASYFGFEISENRRPAGFCGWLARLGEAIYLWGMVRTFNRHALKTSSLMKPVWFQFWISREKLLTKYGAVRLPQTRFQPAPEMPAQAKWQAA